MRYLEPYIKHDNSILNNTYEDVVLRSREESNYSNIIVRGTAAIGCSRSWFRPYYKYVKDNFLGSPIYAGGLLCCNNFGLKSLDRFPLAIGKDLYYSNNNIPIHEVISKIHPFVGGLLISNKYT